MEEDPSPDINNVETVNPFDYDSFLCRNGIVQIYSLKPSALTLDYIIDDDVPKETSRFLSEIPLEKLLFLFNGVICDESQQVDEVLSALNKPNENEEIHSNNFKYEKPSVDQIRRIIASMVWYDVAGNIINKRKVPGKRTADQFPTLSANFYNLFLESRNPVLILKQWIQSHKGGETLTSGETKKLFQVDNVFSAAQFARDKVMDMDDVTLLQLIEEMYWDSISTNDYNFYNLYVMARSARKTDDQPLTFEIKVGKSKTKQKITIEELPDRKVLVSEESVHPDIQENNTKRVYEIIIKCVGNHKIQLRGKKEHGTQTYAQAESTWLTLPDLLNKLIIKGMLLSVKVENDKDTLTIEPAISIDLPIHVTMGITPNARKNIGNRRVKRTFTDIFNGSHDNLANNPTLALEFNKESSLEDYLYGYFKEKYRVNM